MFSNEAALVDRFVKSVEDNSPWGELVVRSEFFYQRGRADLVAFSDEGQVIAFEAKLTKWRIGLQQAYRNRCFADLSYLVLPEDTAGTALRHVDEFIRRGVGLCSVSGGHVRVLNHAEPQEPIQLWLRQKAIDHIERGGDNGSDSEGDLR